MNSIEKHLTQVRQGLELLDPNEIEEVMSVLNVMRRRGGTVYLCGNGGSAALASHFANDLMKMGKLRAVCLSEAFPVVSAYGNDEGWENMYLNPLMVAYEYDMDCLIGITCSGNSENVVRALEWVYNRSGWVIGLTGQDRDSKIHLIGSFPMVHANVPDIRVQEDLHSVACHAIARGLAEEEE